MNEIVKSAALSRQSLSEADLDAINRQALRELSADEVFAFRLAACNNQLDRDNERFSDQCLEQLALLFTGKPVLMDHNWSATTQTARIFAAEVAPMPGVEGGKQLELKCYMLRSEDTKTAIANIEGGILRECSVGCAVEKATCSICGGSYFHCNHYKGEEYEGKACHVILSEAADAYEVSLVAVPAQPGAGVIKAKGAAQKCWTKQARQQLDMEQVRYGALRL